MQDKLIDMKGKNIDKVKFMPHELSDTDLVILGEEHPASFIRNRILNRKVRGVTFLSQTTVPDSSLVMLDEEISKKEDPSMNKKVHAIFHKGKARIVASPPKLHGESPALKKPFVFSILSLDTMDRGTFKSKSYNRTHLPEVY
jgi:hypothetical protein